jgi:hypothetical protein
VKRGWGRGARGFEERRVDIVGAGATGGASK